MKTPTTPAFDDLKTYLLTLSPQEAVAFLQCSLNNAGEDLMARAAVLPPPLAIPIMRDAWVCMLAIDLLDRVVGIVPDHRECSAALKFTSEKFLQGLQELRARRDGAGIMTAAGRPDLEAHLAMPAPPDGYAACRTGYSPQVTHLVRLDSKGSNGGRPTMCRLTRFPTLDPNTREVLLTADIPGWSMGGGVSGPGVVQLECPACYSRAGAPQTQHVIRWTYDLGSVRAEAVCTAPPGADCRLTSVSCECERWGEIQRRDDGTIWHKIVDQGDSFEPVWHQVQPFDDCNVCLFINESGCVEELGGRIEFVIAETPIRPLWFDEGCDWEPVGVNARPVVRTFEEISSPPAEVRS